MDRDETKEVLTLIRDTYSVFNNNPPAKIKSSALDNWAALFADDPQELVISAVKAFIVSDTKGFAPVPGQIKEKIRLMTHKGERTELEAWELVRKAIVGGRDSFREVWEKLPADVQEIVSPGQLKEWSITDLSQQQVISSNFMRSYRSKIKDKHEFDCLPEDIKHVINKLKHQLPMEKERLT